MCLESTLSAALRCSKGFRFCSESAVLGTEYSLSTNESCIVTGFSRVRLHTKAVTVAQNTSVCYMTLRSALRCAPHVGNLMRGLELLAVQPTWLHALHALPCYEQRPPSRNQRKDVKHGFIPAIYARLCPRRPINMAFSVLSALRVPLGSHRLAVSPLQSLSGTCRCSLEACKVVARHPTRPNCVHIQGRLLFACSSIRDWQEHQDLNDICQGG